MSFVVRNRGVYLRSPDGLCFAPLKRAHHFQTRTDAETQLAEAVDELDIFTHLVREGRQIVEVTYGIKWKPDDGNSWFQGMRSDRLWGPTSKQARHYAAREERDEAMKFWFLVGEWAAAGGPVKVTFLKVLK